METAIIILHVLLCFFLIVVILLQSGKGGDMGAVFGGSSSSTFGGRGAATFLSKTTSVVAALFMFTSLSLAVLSSRVDEESVISDDAVPLESTAPLPAPARPGMENNPMAAKAIPAPVTTNTQPVQVPDNADKAASPTPEPMKSSPSEGKPKVEQEKIAPITTGTAPSPKAPQKDEKAKPAPATTTP